MECPYCGTEALKPLSDNNVAPAEVFFSFMTHGEEVAIELIRKEWRAYKCETCLRLLILEEDEVRRIENAA